ncbi:hypothetical protein IEQ34_001160 [Dendrobium chrysotoxum]|uniref:Uncharacterized protein n=1 Tax=Dendrobium chrysotoxum TaxID=161865 RepID=A0AAV7HL33_DENCH|nr:hypothetical protein IEQ34_001160 [Dendrobium chrysotoxum]
MEGARSPGVQLGAGWQEEVRPKVGMRSRAGSEWRKEDRGFCDREEAKELCGISAWKERRGFGSFCVTADHTKWVGSFQCKQDFIDVVEAIFRGAMKGKLIVSCPLPPEQIPRFQLLFKDL